MTRRGLAPIRFAGGLAAIAAVALVVRGVHVATLLGSPVGDALVQDARYYHEEALRILDPAGPEAGGVHFMHVGYPYALAALYALVGPSVRVALAVQAVLGALAVAGLGLAGRILLRSEAAGLVAGGLYALDAQAVFYDGLLLTPSLVNACLVAVLLAVASYLERGRARQAAAAGLALGAAILLRGNTLLMVPAVALVIGMARGPAGRARALAAFLLAAAVLPLPFVLRARIVHGAWVPLSANAGMNLWTGNNREAEGVYYLAPFLGNAGADREAEAFLDEARRRTAHPSLTLAGASAFWRAQAMAEVRADPRRWLRLAGRKAALFWTAQEPKTNVSLRFIERHAPPLRHLPVRFAPLAVAGAAGLVLLILDRCGSAASLLAAYVVVPWITCTVFFVSGEYRHPASLALSVLSAATVVALGRWALRLARGGGRTVAWARTALPGAAALAALALALWPWPALRAAGDPSIDARNYARTLCIAAQGEPPPGPDRFARARSLLQGNPRGDPRGAPQAKGDDLILADARLWVACREAIGLRDRAAALRAIDEARSILRHDLRPRPGDPLGFAEYLLAAVQERLADLAAQPFVRADPGLRREAALLGATGYVEAEQAERQGDLEGAVSFLQAALARAPHHVRLQAELGRLLLILGREGEGLRRLRDSCHGWPEIPQCAYYAAEHYEREGNLEQALRAAGLALARDPGFVPAREMVRRLRPAG